ncbi:MAG: hypothetical protein VKK42_24945 [Lyngbya sp.]|nr:hypothetical protein [Lyngbya sp.]
MDRLLFLQNQLAYWNNQVASRPFDPKTYVQRGMVHFKLAEIEASIQDFDQAEELEPTLQPYLWQRGLSYYYARQFQAGANQFELDLVVNSQDVEETIWRYLCIAQLQGAEAAKESLLSVGNDPRKVMRQVYELFSGNCQPEDVVNTGKQLGKQGQFYAHLYVGLYYEAQQDEAQAKEFIVKAASEYPLEDYMWHLAVVHQTLREWV